MKSDLLKEDLGERLDDLQCGNLFLIQNPDEFCFGIDAVLLANFVKVKKGDHIVDLCTGSGIVPLLLSAKSAAKKITGIELQEYMADMAARSVRYNKLEEKIEIINADIAEAADFIKIGSIDAVSVNPPYMKDTTGLKNPDLPLAVARHEIKTSLESVVGISAKLLKENGRLYMVHRPHRLSEIFAVLKENRLEPKRIRFVQAFSESKANMVLIEAIKGAGIWLDVMPALIVYRDKNIYSNEVLEIYGR